MPFAHANRMAYVLAYVKIGAGEQDSEEAANCLCLRGARSVTLTSSGPVPFEDKRPTRGALRK
jgi:hypothetical protein